MKRWAKILIGIIVLTIIGIGYWFYREHKIKKIMELENQKAKFDTVFYVEELPIPFYSEEETEIEKLYNSLITAPIVKVKEDKSDGFVNIDESIVLNKEFSNYKDINVVASESTALPKEKIIDYLEKENNYSKLLQEQNTAEIFTLLMNLAVEERYLEFQKWFEKRGLTDEEILIMQTSMPTDITVIGLDKIAILNNFSVLKGQEILKTVVEYLNYEFYKEAKENYAEIVSDDELIGTIRELLGVAKLELSQNQIDNLKQKLPILREKIREYYKAHPESLELPSDNEIKNKAENNTGENTTEKTMNDNKELNSEGKVQ